MSVALLLVVGEWVQLYCYTVVVCEWVYSYTVSGGWMNAVILLVVGEWVQLYC